MQKEEYNTIIEEMKPFLVDGKITRYTEIKWLEFKKIVKLKNNNINDMALIMGTEYKTQYPEYRKKLNQLWAYKGYIENLKKKGAEAKSVAPKDIKVSQEKPVIITNKQESDPFISDALKKF